MFYIELLDGASRVVGITQTTVNKFVGGETRKIDLRSTIDGLSVSDIRIYPVINIFDPSSFMKTRVPDVKIVEPAALDTEVDSETN